MARKSGLGLDHIENDFTVDRLAQHAFLYVPLSPFASTLLFSLYSSISSFTLLASYLRTSPRLPRRRRLHAHRRTLGYDSVRFLQFRHRYPSSSLPCGSVAGKTSLALALPFPLPIELVRSLFVLPRAHLCGPYRLASSNAVQLQQPIPPSLPPSLFSLLPECLTTNRTAVPSPISLIYGNCNTPFPPSLRSTLLLPDKTDNQLGHCAVTSLSDLACIRISFLFVLAGRYRLAFPSASP